MARRLLHIGSIHHWMGRLFHLEQKSNSFQYHQKEVECISSAQKSFLENSLRTPWTRREVWLVIFLIVDTEGLQTNPPPETNVKRFCTQNTLPGACTTHCFSWTHDCALRGSRLSCLRCKSPRHSSCSIVIRNVFVDRPVSSVFRVLSLTFGSVLKTLCVDHLSCKMSVQQPKRARSFEWVWPNGWLSPKHRLWVQARQLLQLHGSGAHADQCPRQPPQFLVPRRRRRDSTSPEKCARLTGRGPDAFCTSVQFTIGWADYSIWSRSQIPSNIIKKEVECISSAQKSFLENSLHTPWTRREVGLVIFLIADAEGLQTNPPSETNVERFKPKVLDILKRNTEFVFSCRRAKSCKKNSR